MVKGWKVKRKGHQKARKITPWAPMTTLKETIGKRDDKINVKKANLRTTINKRVHYSPSSNQECLKGWFQCPVGQETS